MAKGYKINLKFDISDIDENLKTKKPTELKPGQKVEHYTSQELFKRVMNQSISMSHQKANRHSLQRTLRIMNLIDVTKDEVILAEEDFKYLTSSFNRADGWLNTLEVAVYINRIGEQLDNAQEIEVK